MSWLRSSPLHTSFSKQRSRDSPPKDADPTACYNSFRKHWQQSHDIIQQTLPPNGIPSQDDVLGVVNHVDQMVTLLLLELRNSESPLSARRHVSAPTHSPCMEHLLSENLLNKLYEWSVHSGRFSDAVRLEQLKLYELLVSHSGILLAHEPVTRPLLRLLEDCSNDIMPLEIEKKLIMLLHQLCVTLVQNMALLDLFFQPLSSGKNQFIIFTLLIPRIYREGVVGRQARDAMLLCMSISKKNDAIASYIADQSNVCPVLATGLSGLYSLLPRKLDIETEDWHRLTPEDVNDMPDLMQLINSLEFCNAVVQVSHPLVQKQLLEYLYQGFLVPVMGSALLQDSLGLTLDQLDAPHYRTTVEELVAATAYFDLFIRSVTEPGLLRSLVRFLSEDNYDDCRILDSLIKRISSRSRLGIVTIGLFETLVDLNCEDVMLELCLGALSPCTHIMLSQRRRLRDIDPFGRAADKFLSLAPNCCSPTPSLITVSSPISLPTAISLPGNSTSPDENVKSLPAANNFNARLQDSLYGNYHAYLCDARQKIADCQFACSNWSSLYDGEPRKESNTSSATTLAEETISTDRIHKDTSTSTVDSSKAFFQTEDSSMQQILDNVRSILEENTTNSDQTSWTDEFTVSRSTILSKEEQEKLDANIAELLSEDVGSPENGETQLSDKKGSDSGIDESNTAMNSLLSLGESSGYESFALKGSSESTPDHEVIEDQVVSPNENSNIQTNKENVDVTNTIPYSLTGHGKENLHHDICGQPDVGIFLDIVLRKLECMMSNNVYVNLHLTGLISRLAIYPQPLLQSFLLNHSLVFQPSIRSLFQILASLKQKIDTFLSKYEGVDILVEQARMFLINREDRLVNAKKNDKESSVPSLPIAQQAPTEPFSRGEPKRRSLTSSLSQMFKAQIKRSSSNSGPNSLLSTMSQQTSISEDEVTAIGDGSGYRYYKRSSWESPNEISPEQNVVLCAVVLDEWLKELAAISQEHTIVSLTSIREIKT